jgi:hypothetical protein
MVGKNLMANRQFPSVSYVIENDGRSELADKGNSFQTHDVHGIKGVKSESEFSQVSYVI